MRPDLVAEAQTRMLANRHTVPTVVFAAIVAVGLAPSLACLQRPVDNPNIIVVGVPSGPANLDPRIGTDDTSQKAGQLIFSGLMTLDDRLRIVPQLAERLDNPEPTTYVVTLRRGVRFHDGHELTSADVVHTYRSILSPEFISPIKGAFGLLKAVDARDRYTVVFSLNEPFGSFAANLVVPPIVPDGADSSFHEHPIGTGPYRFVRYLSDDRLELAAFDDYYEGRPLNDGIVLRVVPDDIMRGLELRKGTMDLSVNDLAPDIVYQLQREPALQIVSSPGTDYQYLGLNLRDPILRDRRVRQALAYAIDYKAIVEHLRRGLATPASGIMPPMSWAYEPEVFTFTHDPDRAKRLLDEAGYGDPDGDGSRPRFTLTLKVSNIEFNRLQSAVIQQNLRDVGIRLEVRVYEFATLVRRRAERQLSDVFIAMDGRCHSRSRHPAAHLSLAADAAVRVQPRILRESASRPSSRPSDGVDRHGRAQAPLWGGSTDRRARGSVHQPLGQDQLCGGATGAERNPAHSCGRLPVSQRCHALGA